MLTTLVVPARGLRNSHSFNQLAFRFYRFNTGTSAVQTNYFAGSTYEQGKKTAA